MNTVAVVAYITFLLCVVMIHFVQWWGIPRTPITTPPRCSRDSSLFVFRPMLSQLNHRYTPAPTKATDVPVMAALRLGIPNMLLLFLMTASWAFNCECPDTYVYAPRPMNAPLPAAHELLFNRESSVESRVPITRHGVQSSYCAWSCFIASWSVGTSLCAMVILRAARYVGVMADTKVEMIAQADPCSCVSSQLRTTPANPTSTSTTRAPPHGAPPLPR